MKDATYLPDVRRNSGGQSSTIYIRNNGATSRSTKINFYDLDGSHRTEYTGFLSRNGVWAVLPPSDWQGSAIVNGGEELAVVVRNDGSGISSMDTGFVGGGNGDPAFENASATLYAPAIYNNIFGGFYPTIYLQNTANTNNDVTLHFIGRTDYGNDTYGFTLAGNERRRVPTTDVMGGTSWVGSIRIEADHPVAAKIHETQGAAILRTYSATSAGRSLMYVPAAYKNQWGLDTGLVIQNLDFTSSVAITVTYCERNFSSCVDEPILNLGAQHAHGIYVGRTSVLPSIWTGSVKMESKPKLPLAVAVTNANSTGGYDFNGTNLGSRVVTLPRAAKNNGGRTSGYTVRNTSGANNVSITAKYYDLGGRNHVWSRTFTLNAGQVAGYHQSNDGVPNGWQGSIVLEASDKIIAIMREDTSNTMGGYNGIPR